MLGLWPPSAGLDFRLSHNHKQAKLQDELAISEERHQAEIAMQRGREAQLEANIAQLEGAQRAVPGVGSGSARDMVEENGHLRERIRYLEMEGARNDIGQQLTWQSQAEHAVAQHNLGQGMLDKQASDLVEAYKNNDFLRHQLELTHGGTPPHEQMLAQAPVLPGELAPSHLTQYPPTGTPFGKPARHSSVTFAPGVHSP